MIAKEPKASGETRRQAGELIEEVDRVTSRLNEFIDYSKPREVKPAPTDLAAVVRDVERTLETDREDKEIAFSYEGPQLSVEADESLLRQVVFNLLLNAFQAVDQRGQVQVVLSPNGPGEAVLEVRDSGPGVPPEARENIFRPYFTLNEEGSGLGLAVVRQILLAHNWEIEYIAPQEGGSVFRISGLKVSRKSPVS